jgi:hypothetical protein
MAAVGRARPISTIPGRMDPPSTGIVLEAGGGGVRVSFTVEKWYLDLVTDDGTAVVGYVVDVRWLGLAVRLAARLIVHAGGRREELTTRGDTAWPQPADGRLTWTSESLGVTGEWLALDAPITSTLLATPAGSVEWACLMPRARASVVTPAARYDGLGYAEHLRLTVPPWAVPFHTVRWGRHVSDRHALVWIERDGAVPMRAAWLDGTPEALAAVGPSGVTGLSGGWALRWHAGHVLTDRSVGDAIAGAAPALGSLIAGRLANVREHKQLAASSLVDADGRALDHGWAIHEEVTW